MNQENIRLDILETSGDYKKNEEASIFLERIKKLEEKCEQLTAENHALKEIIEKDLIHDHLTGVKNRKYFEERAEEIISSVKKKEESEESRKEGYEHFSVLFIDIDHFKEINDSLGHEGGDKVLKEISGIIEENVRNSDIVARWGGEEFVVGLQGTNEEEAFGVAEKIRIAVDSHIGKMKTTLSVGVAFCNKDDVDSLIKKLTMQCIKQKTAEETEQSDIANYNSVEV